jgi:TonB family protein
MLMSASFRKRILGFLALSAMLHVAISTMVFSWWPRARPPVVEQSPTKIYPAMLLYAGGSKTKWTPAPPGRKKHPQEVKKTTSDLALSAQPAPAAGRPVDAPESTAAGNGADQQSAGPAFPVFSPRPPVTDRSLLPDSNRQVVVDVKVSATGEVLAATLVQGIGNELDQIVLNTVKTWRFHPATVNGNPVATEAELIFPFNANYPITG